MSDKKKLITFSISMLFAIIFWRLIVFFRKGKISILKEITGLNFHHYTYGIIILTIFLLLYLFYKQNNLIVGFLGFGLGTILDSFISRLFKSGTRAQEIANYNAHLGNSLLLIFIVIFLGWIFYLMSKYKKS